MGFRGMLKVMAAGAIALGGGACSSSTAPASVDLSGTYGLVSIQFGTGTTALTPPTETGNLALSTTNTTGTGSQGTYNLTLSGAQPENDSGTYSISGSSWSQQSSVNGSQSVGTYTLAGTQLTVTTVQQGITVISVWQKQS